MLDEMWERGRRLGGRKESREGRERALERYLIAFIVNN